MVDPIRVGQGFDVHALVPGRRLVLGGVSIEHEQGLLGHSDADVLLHAITDALLGAAALGDIGRLYPDSDPRYHGADSRALLAEVAQRVQQDGWRLGNLDCIVFAGPDKGQRERQNDRAAGFHRTRRGDRSQRGRPAVCKMMRSKPPRCTDG